MYLPEESERNNNNFIRENEGQSNLFFPKHYLLLEVERLEVSIRHFFETGTVSKDDYEYLCITLKMIKKFLTIRLQSPKRAEMAVHHKSRNYRRKFRNKYRLSRHSISRQPSLFDIQKPLPITGEIIVSGLNERLDALKQKSPENIGPKFPYKIPSGTHWNNVIIKFLDQERIEIIVKKQKYITDYKEMGMVGKGSQPGEQWLFLKVLAKYQGEFTIKDPEAKEKYKKQKRALTETLKDYFSIDYDPFYPYHSTPEKSGSSYKIKILLIPPPEGDSRKQNVDNDDADNLGIHEFLNEEAPLVADL